MKSNAYQIIEKGKTGAILPDLFSGNFREIRSANELGHLRSHHPKVQRLRSRADTDSEGRFVENVMVYPTSLMATRFGWQAVTFPRRLPVD